MFSLIKQSFKHFFKPEKNVSIKTDEDKWCRHADPVFSGQLNIGLAGATNRLPEKQPCDPKGRRGHRAWARRSTLVLSERDLQGGWGNPSVIVGPCHTKRY